MSRRSTADRAALTIWRNVISTVAARPADSQAPSFQLFGPSLIRGSKLAFWRTSKTPPPAGQASEPPTASPGIETPTIARSVAVTNWARTEARKIPRTDSVAPTTKRGVTARAGEADSPVGRLGMIKYPRV